MFKAYWLQPSQLSVLTEAEGLEREKEVDVHTLSKNDMLAQSLTAGWELGIAKNNYLAKNSQCEGRCWTKRVVKDLSLLLLEKRKRRVCARKRERTSLT
jgi:hypothetical protein